MNGDDHDPIALTAEVWEKRSLPGASLLVAATSVLLAQQYLVSRLTDVLRPLGLSLSRYEALVLLDFSPDGTLPLARTSERLMVHPSSVTNTIDTLERDGLVRRRPHPSDRRVTVAQITPEGSRLTQRAIDAVLAANYGLPEDMDDDEIARITDALLPLRRAAVGYQQNKRTKTSS